MGVEPDPTVFRGQAGYNLDRSPVHQRATEKRDKPPCTIKLTLMINLESPINLTCMFLDDWSKLEYPERTHTYMG